MKKIMFGNSLMLLGIAIMILAGLELIYITLPDGSTVDLGHFDTADAATKAVQEYLEQQVSSGNISQEEADDLLNNGSTE